MQIKKHMLMYFIEVFYSKFASDVYIQYLKMIKLDLLYQINKFQFVLILNQI